MSDRLWGMQCNYAWLRDPGSLALSQHPLQTEQRHQTKAVLPYTTGSASAYTPMQLVIPTNQDLGTPGFLHSGFLHPLKSTSTSQHPTAPHPC